MNGNEIGVIAVLFGLVAFGIAYNRAVNWARKSGWLEPYTAFWVAAGTLVTVSGISLIDLLTDWNAGLIAILAFAASGAPMILGDAARYVKSIQRNIERDRHDEI